MRIALIDPFFDDSHKRWAEGLQQNSSHEIDIYKGSPHHWKWKMTGGTLPVAKALNDSAKKYDLFLGTDMLNIPLFKSMLIPAYAGTPFVIYFHENQITYPWSADDPDTKKERDHHYGLINYCSALLSEKVFFNSKFHKESFLKGLPKFMKRFPEDTFTKDVAEIQNKSIVLLLGLDLPECNLHKDELPVFIWNHRWEYDKNPELFFNTLFQLKDQEVPFKLIVTGKSFKQSPRIFEKAKTRLKDEIIHFGFVDGIDQYNHFLSQANILFITSHQDFFGISIVEAIAAGCYPVLPDRLAYREHVAEELHDELFYKKDGDVISHLLNVINNKTFLKRKEISDYVKKYEWGQLISEYDKQLSTAFL